MNSPTLVQSLIDVLEHILSRGVDSAHKHTDNSSAKGRWVTFTLLSEDVSKLRSALVEIRALTPVQACLDPGDIERWRWLEQRFAGLKTSRAKNMLDALGIEGDESLPLWLLVDAARVQDINY